MSDSLVAPSPLCGEVVPGSRSEPRTGGDGALRLLNADDADPIRTIGGFDLHLLSYSVAEERLAHGGLVAEGSRFRVGFGRADDLVRLLGLAVLLEPHPVAHPDHARPLRRLDQDVVLDDGFKLLDPSLHEALVVLGR